MYGRKFRKINIQKKIEHKKIYGNIFIEMKAEIMIPKKD